MGEQHYRRSLGLTYDEDAYLLEAANGTGSRVNNGSQEAFARDGSDLYIEQASGGLNDQRLQDIEYLMSLETAPEELVVLEAEKIVRTEVRLTQEAQLNPRYSQALREWLFEELDRRLAEGEPVDDEMYVEADILADFIAEAQADEEDADLILIAEHMKVIIESQRALTDFALKADLSAEEVAELIEAQRRDIADELELAA